MIQLIAAVFWVLVLGSLSHAQNLPEGVTVENGIYKVKRSVLRGLKASQIKEYKKLAKENNIAFTIIEDAKKKGVVSVKKKVKAKAKKRLTQTPVPAPAPVPRFEAPAVSPMSAPVFQTEPNAVNYPPSRVETKDTRTFGQKLREKVRNLFQ